MFEFFLMPRRSNINTNMEDGDSKELCSLCFNSKLETMKSAELVDKIEKYLQLKMEYRWNGVCMLCHKALEEFHDFYERVHAAQRNFKINTLENSTEEHVQQSKTEHCQGLAGETPDNLTTVTRSNEAVEPEIKGSRSETQTTTRESNGVHKTRIKSKEKLRTSKDLENKMLTFYNIKCEKCDDIQFASFKMLSSHYLTIHKTQGYIRCCKRKIRVTDKYYLRNHMLKHLQPDSCRCRICGKELSSLVTLRHHMNLHKPEEERPFQCSECGKRFCCKNDLKNHEMSIHLPENKREDFICDVCGKLFQKVANLRYHYSSVHLQKRKYICEICAKCFTTHSGLRTHITAAHSILDPIQCQECHKWLKTKDTYRKHLQLHQNQSFPCSHCDKICNSSASLRSHLVKHSENRPYTCTVCGKSFKTKNHLKSHASQHDGSSYKCPYCPKLFVNMSNYYTHRRRMHSEEKEKRAENKCETVGDGHPGSDPGT